MGGSEVWLALLSGLTGIVGVLAGTYLSNRSNQKIQESARAFDSRQAQLHNVYQLRLNWATRICGAVSAAQIAFIDQNMAIIKLSAAKWRKTNKVPSPPRASVEEMEQSLLIAIQARNEAMTLMSQMSVLTNDNAMTESVKRILLLLSSEERNYLEIVDEITERDENGYPSVVDEYPLAKKLAAEFKAIRTAAETWAIAMDHQLNQEPRK